VKKGLFILIFVLIGLLSRGGPLDEKISIHTQNIYFPEFCNIIFQKTNLKIYYYEPWIDQINISIDVDSTSLGELLEYAIRGKNITIVEWEDFVLLLSDNKILPQLPDYKTNELISDSNLEINNNLPENENKFIIGRQANTKKTITIGNENGESTNKTANIKGYVKLKENQAPAVGTTMFIEETKTGKIADMNGNFYLSLRPGNYNAIFECVGLKKERYFFEVYSDGSFAIEMEESVLEIDEVVVYGNRQTNIKTKDPGLEKLIPKAIKELPMMMGERDLLKVSEMLPGIVSVGEGSAGLNVRGGNSDQNAFYINEIPIYNTSHLFGFFPIFNSDIISDFLIYKGHIPAQFGGRLSSVFDIHTRSGNMNKYSIQGGVNPVSANMTIEGPLINDKFSFLLNGRTTYSDWILSRINDPIISSSSASFNDFSSSLNYYNKGLQVALFVYYSEDKFVLSDINSFQYGNKGISLNISKTIGASLQVGLTLIGADYNNKTIDMQEALKAYSNKYNIGHYEAKIDFKHSINKNNNLEYGVSLIRYNLNRGSIQPYRDQSLINQVNLGNESGYEGAVFLSDIYNMFPWLSVTAGVRFSVYAPVGPKTINTYANGLPRDNKNIVDSIVFGSNEVMKWNYSPDIRIAANIETDPKGSVKVSFNQMQQNMFMLNNTISIAPNTQWKLSDYYINPSRSNQFSVGVFRNIPKGNWESSLELYYKTTNNYPEFKDGADFMNTSSIETQVLQGTQKSYGIEFYLKRSNKKLDGWLSYTYSRSFVEVDGENSWEKINKGEPYPSNFDIPHVLNTVINYHFNKRVSVASVLNYQTGRPVTYPTSIYYINGIQYVDYSSRNEYRIPDYFRMDLSLTIEGNLKKNKLIHSSWIFSLYNLTGRNNAYSVYFKTENGLIKSYKYSVIGVQFFTITWLFKLGNYDTE